MNTFRAGILLALVAACGCSKSGPSARLSGTVTYNGQPVRAGELYFVFYQGGQYQASIKSDGTYQVNGLPEGDVVVIVQTETYNPDKQSAGYVQQNKRIASGIEKNYSEYDRVAGKNRGGDAADAPAAELSKEKREELARVYVKIPKKYGDKTTSPISFVVGSGAQTKDLELTD